MKKLFSILSAISFALIISISAAAQSSPASGQWDVALNTPGGVRNFKAIINVEGEKLTGEIRRDTGNLPIQGTAKGKDVKFSYTVNYNGNDLTITLTGTVEGDTMKGVADFGGNGQDEWSAKRASATTVSSAPAASASPSSEKFDVSGAWSVEVQTDAGSGSPSFTFKQEGEKLTGRYKGAFGEADLTGTLKGNQIEFSVKVSGQIEGIVTYSGTTDGKTMKGKVSLAGLGEGTFTGKKN